MFKRIIKLTHSYRIGSFLVDLSIILQRSLVRQNNMARVKKRIYEGEKLKRRREEKN
ncbi:unnamed protein product [Larinioides sclopetarius]|uniref:Uncharacterized protein n=1 Tax=Larinioides sclopetarius TaxID=280406 RepID=A0AAV1YWX2_9ARAC